VFIGLLVAVVGPALADKWKADDDPPYSHFEQVPAGRDLGEGFPTAEVLAETRQNSSAVEVQLGPGLHTAGVDFAPGRYSIAPVGLGEWTTLHVKPLPESDYPFAWTAAIGVSIRFDQEVAAAVSLPDGAVLNVGGGGPEIKLVPAPPSGELTSLGPGDWEIGVDIPPGRYRLDAPNRAIGTVHQLAADPVGDAVRTVSTYELDGGWAEDPSYEPLGDPSVELDLLEGDVIVTDLALVNLTRL
jgi:hypothetical protein